jgi:trehalose 2-sulfotransferase
MRFPGHYNPSVHEKRIVDYFGEDIFVHKSHDWTMPRSVFLCFANRSGSNFLAESLASTGRLPTAGEFFNAEYVQEFSQKHGLRTFDEYCRALIAQRSKAPFFASKVAWQQLYFLCRSRVIPTIFGAPNFIFIRRRDVLDQAISFSIADQTKAWTSEQKANNDAAYNVQDITNRIRGLTQSNARFEEFFALNGIYPFEVVYEDFVEDVDGTVARVTEWLGLGRCSVRQETIRLERQAGTTNRAWRERFLTEVWLLEVSD